MKQYVLVCLLLIPGVTAFTQRGEKAAVKQTVLKLFNAMRRADSAALVETFATGATLNRVVQTTTGTDTLQKILPTAFGKSVKRFKPGELDERIRFQKILMDGNVAFVWTPYRFFLKGQFSHCGVNGFVLARINGAWKIQNLMDTERKTGCNSR